MHTILRLFCGASCQSSSTPTRMTWVPPVRQWLALSSNLYFLGGVHERSGLQQQTYQNPTEGKRPTSYALLDKRSRSPGASYTHGRNRTTTKTSGLGPLGGISLMQLVISQSTECADQQALSLRDPRPGTTRPTSLVIICTFPANKDSEWMTQSGFSSSAAMRWKHSYLWRPRTHLKGVALPYFLHSVIHSLWCPSVWCHDGLHNSVRSGALDATLHIVAESRPRGYSARSILSVDVVVTSRHTMTAIWRSAGMRTTQHCKTSTCFQSSVDKATWLRGFVVDASDVFSSIGFTTTTLAPPLRQASQCRHSSSTTTATHPAGRERRRAPVRCRGGPC